MNSNLDDEDFLVTPDLATKLMIGSITAGTLAAICCDGLDLGFLCEK